MLVVLCWVCKARRMTHWHGAVPVCEQCRPAEGNAMADVTDRLRLLAAGEAPVPAPFEGAATWMRLDIEEARELLARLDALEGVVNAAYADACCALVWAFDPNTDASGDLPRAMAELLARLEAANAELRGALKVAHALIEGGEPPLS